MVVRWLVRVAVAIAIAIPALGLLGDGKAVLTASRRRRRVVVDHDDLRRHAILVEFVPIRLPLVSGHAGGRERVRCVIVGGCGGLDGW